MAGRISLAQKNLFHEPIRLLISVSGVTFAVFLILILLALYRGWSETLSEYIYNVDKDIWVMQEGSIDMSHSISLLPNGTVDQLRTIAGVSDVQALIGNRVVLDIAGAEVTTRVIGFDTEANIGGPVELVDGTALPQTGEIVIDEIMSREYDLALGDPLTIKDKTFTIVGIAVGGPLFQQSYVTQADARALFNLQELTNFFIVSITDEAATETVLEDIETAVPGVDAQTTAEFATNNEKEIMDKFVPIIFVLVFIGFIVGVVIISLTIYTATLEKIREYGVLKAIGAPNIYLYRVVFVQSAMAGGMGFGLGVIVTFFTSDLVRNIEPMFVTLLKWQDVMSVAGLTLGMIVLAAYIPLRRVMKIDPAIVFKA
ncbi:MAG: hypothetical protein ACD_41C00221G0003 [uncultured bacterium]|nr:MAG: hypothetical protein ACD_41C00221G0003 [uncultured bacterium]